MKQIHPDKTFTRRAVRKQVLFSPEQAENIEKAVKRGVAKNENVLIRDAVAFYLGKKDSPRTVAA